MGKAKYPVLEVNTAHLRENVAAVTGECAKLGISVVGVIKGASGIPAIVDAFEESSVDMIASSRLEQLEDAAKAGSKKPKMLIRIPMISELEDVVRITDACLVSDPTVIEALDRTAGEYGKVYDVILMSDLGDLREGIWGEKKLIETALAIENRFKNLNLIGLGTNLGCYGSIVPTAEKLAELAEQAEKLEAALGRKLKYVSGGATSSLMRVIDKDMPKGINMLRIGEGILNGIPETFGYDMEGVHRDCFRLKAEIVEADVKPSYPVGQLGIDAYGNTPEYEDIGMRKKAILAVGRVDYGETQGLVPLMKGVKILGASCDHTILDITDAEQELKAGDILTFDIHYINTVHLTASRNVNIVYAE